MISLGTFGTDPRRISALLGACLLGALAQPRAAAQERTMTLGGRDVVVWQPSGGSGRRPVLVFSHGFGGCATQSRFITQGLASHGYWVVAPNHKDARCGGARRSGGAGAPAEPFSDPSKWTDHTYLDRADDIRAVVKALGESPELASQMDLSRIGLVGHSLGGYTVLGLAGAWQSWKMPGVKAVLALSPYNTPFLAHNTISGVAAPVMYQGGTLDLGITPSVRKADGAYARSPSPKYFVELTGAGHFAWTNLRTDFQDDILAYSVAFLDHYILGAVADSVLMRATAHVSEVRYESDLGTGDVTGSRGRRLARP